MQHAWMEYETIGTTGKHNLSAPVYAAFVSLLSIWQQLKQEETDRVKMAEAENLK